MGSFEPAFEGVVIAPDEAFFALLLEHCFHPFAIAATVSRSVVAISTAGDGAVGVDPAGTLSSFEKGAGVGSRAALDRFAEATFYLPPHFELEAVEARLAPSPFRAGQAQGLGQGAAAGIAAPAARPRRPFGLEGGGAFRGLGVEDGEQLGHGPSLPRPVVLHPGSAARAASLFRYFDGSPSKAARQPPQQK